MGHLAEISYSWKIRPCITLFLLLLKNRLVEEDTSCLNFHCIIGNTVISAPERILLFYSKHEWWSINRSICFVSFPCSQTTVDIVKGIASFRFGLSALTQEWLQLKLQCSRAGRAAGEIASGVWSQTPGCWPCCWLACAPLPIGRRWGGRRACGDVVCWGADLYR